MNVVRRKFLKALGAAPLAAKVAADTASAELIGLSKTTGAAYPPAGLSVGPSADNSQSIWKAKVLRFLAETTLPEWVDEELRLRHRHVGYLDPDIACKKSWSLNVKIATQRERNIERARHDVKDGLRRGLRQRELEEKFGVWI